MTGNDLDYDRQRPLYLPDGTRLGIADAGKAVAWAYQQNTPVLIYVHGRAKGTGEPRKSVEKKIYAGLGKAGCAVVGFTWDAAGGGYDEAQPYASAPAFDQLLDALGAFLAAPGNAGKPRPSVLAHSMGNLVVSRLAADGRLKAARGRLLSNLVLSAAAVKSKQHAAWLNQIGIAEKAFVLVNPHDPVLRLASLGPRPALLGRDLRGSGASAEVATYVDIGPLDLGHRYFIPGGSGQGGQESVRRFFAAVLTGGAPDFAAIAVDAAVDGVAVKRLRTGLA